MRRFYPNSHGVRFIIVGVINTAVDFCIFLSLSGIGFPVLVANFISTSVALAGSFVLNKNFTFSNREVTGSKLLVKFIPVTLVGLWVLQPLLIQLLLYVKDSVSLDAIIANHDVGLVAAKAIAIVGSMVWNFLWYSRFVFKEEKSDD